MNAGLVATAVAAVGVAYGAMTVGSGFPMWFAPVVGVLVLAASSELLFVGVLAAGGNPWLAALTALTVNARHLPYGLAVAHLLGQGWRRILRIHLVNDETVVFALAQRDHATGRRALTLCGLAILAAWPAGAILGSLLGRALDVRSLGLDAMFPAVILALILPDLRKRETRWGCLVGAAVALASTPFAPPGVPPLLALAALPLMRKPAQKPPALKSSGQEVHVDA